MVLVGVSRYDSALKRVVKEYITEETETYSSPKNGGVPFPTAIPNDLGIVVESLEKFYAGDYFIDEEFIPPTEEKKSVKQDEDF